jgi:hypothetical protein
MMNFDFGKLKEKFTISCNGCLYRLETKNINFVSDINIMLNPLDVMCQLKEHIYKSRNNIEVLMNIGIQHHVSTLTEKYKCFNSYIKTYDAIYRRSNVIAINDLCNCEVGMNRNCTKKFIYSKEEIDNYHSYASLMMNMLPQVLINFPMCIGCKNINLCGFDMPKFSNHFYDSNYSSLDLLTENVKKTFNEARPTQLYWDKYFFALSLMKYKAQLNNITITQLNSDSLIKIFDCDKF